MNEDHNGCRSGNGHYRVQNDAELAVVGVGWIGVEVRNLGKGQGGEQNKAQSRHDRQKHRPASILTAEKCPNWHQSCDLDAFILQKNSFFWTRWERSGCPAVPRFDILMNFGMGKRGTILNQRRRFRFV
jgi:hypothetical protein